MSSLAAHFKNVISVSTTEIKHTLLFQKRLPKSIVDIGAKRNFGYSTVTGDNMPVKVVTVSAKAL